MCECFYVSSTFIKPIVSSKNFKNFIFQKANQAVKVLSKCTTHILKNVLHIKYVTLQKIPRFTRFSITRFSITRFSVLVQKNLHKDKYLKLNRNFFDIFLNIFCLYYDLYNANFDLRGFWAATTTA